MSGESGNCEVTDVNCGGTDSVNIEKPKTSKVKGFQVGLSLTYLETLSSFND